MTGLKAGDWQVQEFLEPARVGIDLCYPRQSKFNQVEVGLMDTRAADSLLISYDFERDGWVIKQASRFRWTEDEEPDQDWQEVAFVQAWAREADGDE